VRTQLHRGLLLESFAGKQIASVSPSVDERAFQQIRIERFDKVIEDVKLHRRDDFFRVRLGSLNNDDGMRVSFLDLLDEIMADVGKIGIQHIAVRCSVLTYEMQGLLAVGGLEAMKSGFSAQPLC